jgi:hypothetical protein
MRWDIPRVVLLVAGLAAGIGAFAWAPVLGSRAEAFGATVVTVFSVLAGIQLAIFALLGELRPSRFRKGTVVDAARRVTKSKRWRQLFLFYAYIIVMILIVLDQAFDFGTCAPFVERTYVAASLATLVWSLGLPVALSAIQDDSA